jgi:hypothetical protein
MAACVEWRWQLHVLQFAQWQSAGRPRLKHKQVNANGPMDFKWRQQPEVDFAETIKIN